MKYYKSDVLVFVFTHLVPEHTVFAVPDDTPVGVRWTEVDAQGQPVPQKQEKKKKEKLEVQLEPDSETVEQQ